MGLVDVSRGRVVLTADILRAIMPNAGPRINVFLEPLRQAMDEFEISDYPRRQAAFLGQISWESGELRYVRELWGPTPAQQGYEGRADLGNTQAGDGKRYMGRGLIQVTGRANYGQCGAALGLDLLAHPELLETPTNACRSAAWYWWSRGLNTLADAENYPLITRRINGGMNGYADRVAYWQRAQDAIA